jgi:hypothetical protein
VIEEEEEKGKNMSVQEITSEPHVATNTGLGTNFTYERKTNLLTDDDRQASLTIPMCQYKPGLCCRTKFGLIIHNFLYAMTLDAELMSDIEDDTKKVGEKMKGGAKDAGEKISDTGRDMEAEAKKAKDKIKEKLD